MTYYTLLMRETPTAWAIQFGDACQETVRDELDDMLHSNVGAKRDDGSIVRVADFKIIKTSDNQASINAAVAALNKA